MRALISQLSIIIISCSFASAQRPIEIIPIANDSTKDEIDPYLTFYWYQGFFNHRQCNIIKDYQPIWLAFVEIDQQNNYRVVARNFIFDFEQAIEISKKYVISDTILKAELRHPIIENFSGKPIAIWTQKSGVVTDLYYSVFDDSTWSYPGLVTNDLLGESSVVFITHDAYGLEYQNDFNNFLFWFTDSSINMTSLTPNFDWKQSKTIYSGRHSINHLKARFDTNDNLWLLFDELYSVDSLYVKTLILSSDRQTWKGPYTLLNLAGTKSEASLCLHYDYYSQSVLNISWIEEHSLYQASVFFLNDSVRFVQENSNPVVEEMMYPDYASNNLLPGGCLISPVPYYFFSKKQNDLVKLFITCSNCFSFPEAVAATVNYVDDLVISGLHHQHFLCGWSEWDGHQHDITVLVNFIQIGGSKEQTNLCPGSIILYQNWPNPFNPRTTITYTLNLPQKIEIFLYNTSGQKVKTLYSGYQIPGMQSLILEASDLPAGIYVYQLKSGYEAIARKCILIK